MNKIIKNDSRFLKNIVFLQKIWTTDGVTAVEIFCEGCGIEKFFGGGTIAKCDAKHSVSTNKAIGRRVGSGIVYP